MKILHIIPWANGGIGSLVKKLIKNKDDNIVSDVAMFVKSEDFSKELSKYNCNIYHLKSLKGYGVYEYVKSIYKVVSEGNYDVVHVHLVHKSYIAIIIASFCKVNIIATHAHASNFGKRETLPDKIGLYINRIISKRLSDILFTSSDLASEFLYGKNTDAVLLKNGVSDSIFRLKSTTYYEQLRSKFINDSNELLLLHVGQFSYAKNYDYLLKISLELSKQNIKHKLLLLGTGKGETKIKAKVNQLKLNDKIIFTGFVNNVNDYLHIADCLVFPSFFEGLPTAVVESQACGLPSIISNTITSQCDLEIGILEYESISLEPSHWVEKILHNNRKQVPKLNNQYLKNVFISKGFTSKGVAIKYYETLRNKKNKE